MKKKVVFILGPTGSGKTALAVLLAKKFEGEIISADSRQIYKGLDVGTAKEGVSKSSKFKVQSSNQTQNSKLEKIINNTKYIDEIPQYLIDVAEPEERFTLFDWLEQARVALEDIFSQGKLPIVVGGTGLYAKALAEGYQVQKSKVQNPKFKQNPNSKIQRDKLDATSIEELHELIKKLKINSENLDMQNPRRLIRAIEKAQEGIETTKVKPNFESLILAIDLDREILYERIDKRVDVRFATQGMLEEVEGLLESGVSKDWLGSLGLEYKIISEYLTQNSKLLIKNFESISNDQIFKSEEFREMAQELKFKTHGYARRQLTWLRKQDNLIWINGPKQASALVEKFLN